MWKQIPPGTKPFYFTHQCPPAAALLFLYRRQLCMTVHSADLNSGLFRTEGNWVIRVGSFCLWCQQWTTFNSNHGNTATLQIPAAAHRFSQIGQSIFSTPLPPPLNIRNKEKKHLVTGKEQWTSNILFIIILFPYGFYWQKNMICITTEMFLISFQASIRKLIIKMLM